MVRFILALLVVIVAAELFVRALITSPSAQTYDEELGWVYIPRSTVLHAQEGFARNRLNNNGMNDVDFDASAEGYNVYVLGDSFTEALQVPRSYNFTSQIELMSPEVNMLNMGRSALGPAQYPIIVRRMTEHITPDLIVVVLTSGDLKEMFLSNPRVIKNPDTGEILDIELEVRNKDQLKRVIEPLITHSALATYMMRRLKPVVLDIIKSISNIQATVANYISEQVPDSSLGVAQVSNGMAVGEVEPMLRFLFSELQKSAPVRLVYIPSMRFQPNRIVTVLPEAAVESDIIARVAVEKGIPFCDAVNYLTDLYRKTGQPPFGFANSRIGTGHLNKNGHVAIAGAVYDVIQSDIQEWASVRSGR